METAGQKISFRKRIFNELSDLGYLALSLVAGVILFAVVKTSKD